MGALTERLLRWLGSKLYWGLLMRSLDGWTGDNSSKPERRKPEVSKPKTRWIRLRKFMLPLLMLSACSSGKSTESPSSLCLMLDRPEWSERDTLPTQAWFERYAIKWERLGCG